MIDSKLIGNELHVIVENIIFDGHCLKDFRESYLSADNADKLIIDMQQVKEMTSEGLGMLLYMNDEVGTKFKIEIRNCSDPVKEQIAFADIDKVITVL